MVTFAVFADPDGNHVGLVQGGGALLGGGVPRSAAARF